MFFKKLFICESRLVFMAQPRNPETGPKGAESPEAKNIPKGNQEAIKKLQDELKEAKKHDGDFDKFVGNNEVKKTYDKPLTTDLGGDLGIEIAKKLPSRVRQSKKFKEFYEFLVNEINITTGPHSNNLNQNLPITAKFGPKSSLEFYNEKNKFSLKFDLKTDSPRLRLIQSQIDDLSRARENRDEKKEGVKEDRREARGNLKAAVNPQANFELLANESKSQYLKKQGDIYVVDFKEGKKIDSKAEKETQIQDLLDLSRLEGGNMYVRIHIDGKSPEGKKHQYWAYYHPSQKTFIREGSTERARIFHGTKISQITYETRPPKEVQAPVATPEVQQTRERSSEKERQAEREFKVEEKNWQNIYNNDNYIFENARFYVPEFIQDDKHFKENWARIGRILDDSLSGPPFNLESSKARREYIQNVIQDGLNSRLYAEDFFKYQINGKYLYKDKNGYKKFVRDFNAVDEEMAKLNMDYANPKNQKERDLAKKWNELRGIAIGLGRVFEAISRLDLHFKNPETNKDIYETKFLGLESLTEQEKERLGAINYHNLNSLLHKTENAPASIDIGINNLMLNEIKARVIENEVPDTDIAGLLREKGGLKLMFMAFGLDYLIKNKCIKKLDDTHYVIVKIPENGWAEALTTLNENKAKLNDHSENDLKKWEAVRASIDKGMQARNFILKIFKPTDSQIKQNINWWQKMWHWEGGSKQINMEYLGSVTLNPTDLEKHVAKDRGYLDMMEKTSKRVEGTSLYEPQKDEVLKLSNQYLETGLLATFKHATPKNLENVTNQILRDFDISNKVNLKKPLNKEENRLENVKLIYQAIELKDIDPSKITTAYIRMIQVGYVSVRQIETAKEWHEQIGEHFSSRPLYRSIQLQALRNGCPIYKLKEIEQRIHLAVFGLSQGMHVPGVKEFNFRGLGAAASIELGEWGGHKWRFNFGVAGPDGKFMPFAGIGGVKKLDEKVNFNWGIGTTVGFTGASAGFEFPITSAWDMYMAAGVGLSWGGGVGVGGAIGFKWNQMRSDKIRENKTLSERNIEKIENAINEGNMEKAAELIVTNPTFGAYAKRERDRFGLPDKVVVDIYEEAKTEWLNAARRGQEIPAVVGAGASAFVGLGGVGFGAYVKFKIPGTEVNYVIRHEHPQYSEFVQTKSAEIALERELSKIEGQGRNVISSFTLKANSGIVYFDSRLGRGNVTRPKDRREMERSIAVKEKEQTANLANKSTFESIKRTFQNLDMHVEMVPDPKNPKNKILAITPLQTEASNVEMLIDPDLETKGMIFDRQNNRILLAASEASKLYVTRTKYRYPFRRRGAMNLEVISFKNNPDRSNLEIREDSPQYIYKYQGERYAMVKGEARTGLAVEKGNTMTVEQYRERRATYESFKDRKPEYTMEQGRDLTTNMSEAVGQKEQEPVRFDELKLEDFTKDVLRKNLRTFELGIANADTPSKEAAFKVNVFRDIKADFKNYAKNVLGNENLEINEQELNLIYTYMLNESFLKLQDKSDAVINRRLEARNNLFRNYAKKYVSDFARNNPERWAEITAIDPSVTPDSIANYLMLTMPQNARQFKEFLQRQQLPIDEGLKFASYTQKGRTEAFATSYGMEMPEKFQDIFKLVGPTKLDVNSPNPRERAAARLVLQVMSPLDTKNLETVEGKKNFLQSELSLLVITMEDPDMRISPMIEILGKKNYQGMLAIYKALNSNNLAEVIKTNEQAFNQFKEIVTGIRNAQLNGDPTFVFKNKYTFHLDKTEVYSGPYLKCGNGTIAARQQIGISVKQEQVGQWHGARTAVNISVIPNERVGYKTMTLGWVHTFKRRPGKDNPPSDDEPGKENTPSDTESTPVETPVSDRPSDDL